MNLTTYFLKHPVVAVVLNVMIVIVGLLCFDSLPLREYPEVRFPKIRVTTYYPNASAETVENAITNPLEDKLAGIEGIETITSDSSHGESYISITFKGDTSVEKSLIAIRDAISLIQLPSDVKPPIVERKTASDGTPFVVISLEGSVMDFAELTHYANLNLKNVFRSLKGVSSVDIWGQPYTYNITLDADKMYAFGVNADEIFDALKKANVSLPVGKFQNEISVTMNVELKTVESYENLMILDNHGSSSFQSPVVLLKDVATIKLQGDEDRFRVRINGKPGLCIGIHKANDASPLEVSNLVRKELEAIQQNLPHGLKTKCIMDQADFVRYSLKNIKSSLVEAILFVLFIVFLFLRNIKATLIPLVTIPISLIGSFLFLKMFGFSINIMTLLAMVLGIGLVVDDAIIMLENIQRHREEGLSPLDAALTGSKEIGFAIMAMTLTLTSVYAPLAFVTGTTGDLFIEFAVALAGSVLMSGVVALTLSPLMCAKTLSQQTTSLWPKMDDVLESLTIRYQKTLAKVLDYQKTCLVVFCGAFGLIWFLSTLLPSETAPKEDRDLMGIYVPPIVGKDIHTIEKKVQAIEAIIKDIPEADELLVFIGDWGGSVVMPLKPQSLRKRSAKDVADAVRPLVDKIPDLMAQTWSWDSGLPGMDDSMGKKELSLTISATDTYASIFDHVEKVRKTLESKKVFQGGKHDLKLDTASYRVDIDQNAMGRLGLTTKQVAKAIEVFFSGDQSLNFSKDGLLYAVTLKGKTSPWTLNEIYVTNSHGKRISLGAVAKLVATSGPDKLSHTNQMRSVSFNVDVPQGLSFGKAMTQFFEDVSVDLPASYKKTWAGAAKVYSESKTTMALLFLLAIIFIFAILSVQFENFMDPCIILLTVPLACLGGLLFVWIFKGSLNVYTQIGLITLIGLITKHGILIVEFANQLTKTMAVKDAMLKASALRLRPILMTTGAMLFGVIPLVLSSDAGHEAQRAIGIVLVGGLSFGTFFTLFILPTVYTMVKGWGKK